MVVFVFVVVDKEVTDIVMFREFLDVARNLGSTVCKDMSAGVPMV
jgi:hypothetical protein